MNNRSFARIKNRIIIFYLVLTSLILTFAALTWAWWNKAAVPNDMKQWHLVYAKVAPLSIIVMYTVFNIWIQCSNRSISRDIIMPWSACRCSLYTFLLILPMAMTIVELIGIFQYKNYWATSEFYVGYYYLFGLALLVATWFQLTIMKWCCFVRRAINLRERRV
jgi:hypothetical protein